jgi:hypothetical protein
MLVRKERLKRGRRPDYRLAKTHRSYTVEEIADLFGVHENTVRAWLARGLPTIDDVRPALIHGAELRKFLRDERTQRKQPCGPGEMYCVKCRAVQRPALAMAEYVPFSPTSGNLEAICPACERMMNRRVSRAFLEEIAAGLDVSFAEAV